MSQNSSLNKILSSYILNKIIENISSLKKLKLFKYSRNIQNKLNLSLLDYQEKYIERFNLNWKKFLSIIYSTERSNNISLQNDKIIKDINFLSSKLSEKLSENSIKLDDAIIKEIAYNYFRKLKIKNKKEEYIFDGEKYIKTPKDILIDIYSPLFGHICQEEIFQKIFSIVLIERQINSLNLKSDYISFFKKLNDIKAKYASLSLYLNNPKEIDYIKDFNINITQIQRLNIYIQYFLFEFEYFFNTLFSFNNIEKNLTYLNLDFFQENDQGVTLEKHIFNGINNFKALLYLKISSINFEPNFEFNLPNLKEIKFFKVNNITFSESYPNLTKLKLKQCIISNHNKLMICPQLEICKLDLIKNDNQKNTFIDFSKYIKLIHFEGDAEDFLKLDNNNPLKIINIISKNDLSMEENIFKKIFSLKTLEKINLIIYEITFEAISKIPGINTTVKELSIIWMRFTENCSLYDFQNKFPNLLSLNLKFPFDLMEDEDATLTINENNNYKINELFIKGIGKANIELFTGPFTNLKKVDFTIDKRIKNIKTFFPIFNDICPIIFHNLNTFEFCCIYGEILNNELLNNIYKNIDKMPNLKRFYFMCISNEANEEFYKAFIKKVLGLKLNYVYLCLMKINKIPEEKYTFDELRQFCNEINCNKEEINVYKFIEGRRKLFFKIIKFQ